MPAGAGGNGGSDSGGGGGGSIGLSVLIDSYEGGSGGQGNSVRFCALVHQALPLQQEAVGRPR